MLWPRSTRSSTRAVKNYPAAGEAVGGKPRPGNWIAEDQIARGLAERVVRRQAVALYAQSEVTIEPQTRPSQTLSLIVDRGEIPRFAFHQRSRNRMH